MQNQVGMFIMVNSTVTHDRWWQKVQKNTELENLWNKNCFLFNSNPGWIWTEYPVTCFFPEGHFI